MTSLFRPITTHLHVYRIVKAQDAVAPQNTIYTLRQSRERPREWTRVGGVCRFIHHESQTVRFDGIDQSWNHILQTICQHVLLWER